MLKDIKVRLSAYANQSNNLYYQNKLLKTKVTLYQELITRIKFILSILSPNNTNSNLNMQLVTMLSNDNSSLKKKNRKIGQEIEKINIGIEILKKISQLKEFKQFISLQDEDEDNSNEEEENASINEESNSTVSNNKDSNDKKENSILNKKTKRDDDVESIIEKVRNRRTKKSYKDKDILKKIKRDFKQSHYIQKLTKSFITRRLNRSIIYEHNFEFVNQTVKDKRITTRGDKGVYKYVIFSFLYPFLLLHSRHKTL